MNELLKNIKPSDIANALKVLTNLGSSMLNQHLDLTIKESINQYESNAENTLSPKSLQSIKCTNRLFLKFFSPLRPVHTITQHDIEKYITHIKKNAPKGYKVYIRTLSAMFNKFIEWNFISINPFDKIKLAKDQKVREDYLSPENVNNIADKAENDLIKNVIVFAYNTGMRLSEITFLEWSSVHLNKKIITVGSERFVTKSKRVRYIPMNDTVYQLLLSIKAADKQNKKYVFGKTASMHFTTDYFSKKFKEAFKKTEIKTDYCFHSLRHGFASRLAQLGVPIITISKALGHQNISTTMIYSQVNLDDLRRAIDKLN